MILLQSTSHMLHTLILLFEYILELFHIYCTWYFHHIVSVSILYNNKDFTMFFSYLSYVFLYVRILIFYFLFLFLLSIFFDLIFLFLSFSFFYFLNNKKVYNYGHMILYHRLKTLWKELKRMISKYMFIVY